MAAGEGSDFTADYNFFFIKAAYYSNPIMSFLHGTPQHSVI